MRLLSKEMLQTADVAMTLLFKLALIALLTYAALFPSGVVQRVRAALDSSGLQVKEFQLFGAKLEFAQETLVEARAQIETLTEERTELRGLLDCAVHGECAGDSEEKLALYAALPPDRAAGLSPGAPAEEPTVVIVPEPGAEPVIEPEPAPEPAPAPEPGAEPTPAPPAVVAQQDYRAIASKIDRALMETAQVVEQAQKARYADAAPEGPWLVIAGFDASLAAAERKRGRLAELYEARIYTRGDRYAAAAAFEDEAAARAAAETLAKLTGRRPVVRVADDWCPDALEQGDGVWSCPPQ